MAFTIVSLNLWHGGRHMSAIIDFLRTADPDIVMLQEVFASEDPTLPDRFRSLETLQAALPLPYADFARALVTDLPEGLVPQGNAILSKYPLQDVAVQHLVPETRDAYPDTPEYWPHEPRVLQTATVALPEGNVFVANMHGVWDLNGENPSDARQQMVDDCLGAVHGKSHIILGGDTNAKDHNPAMQRLEETLIHAFGHSLASTFNMQRKDNPGYATAAVDHLYVSHDLQIVRTECPTVDISDHLPLVVELACA